MTLGEFYKKAVVTGMARDPRGLEEARADLAAAKKEYEGLKKEEKAFFDKERLDNPYPDMALD